MNFDPRPYLDSIAEEVDCGNEIDCPATTAQRIRLAGKEIDRLRADLARANAERDEAVDALKRIATYDYRGNQSGESQIARHALIAMRKQGGGA